jgi:hypothetical protein
MKKHLLTALLLSCTSLAFGQGKSISLQKKLSAPYVRSQGDTLHVKDVIQLTEGTGTNGQFLYVQLVNSFNEPVKPADSRAAGQRQPILFFKEQDGVTYLFTKYFVANAEAAFNKGEVKKAVQR